MTEQEEIAALRREVRELRKAVKESGPVCNCTGKYGLKKLGWKYSLEWDCPKHGHKYICGR